MTPAIPFYTDTDYDDRSGSNGFQSSFTDNFPDDELVSFDIDSADAESHPGGAKEGLPSRYWHGYVPRPKSWVSLRIAAKRGDCVGANVWSTVHIEALGNLYALVYTKALQGEIPHGEEGCYLGCVGEYAWGHSSNIVGEELHKRGLVKDKTPKPNSSVALIVTPFRLIESDISSNHGCMADHCTRNTQFT